MVYVLSDAAAIGAREEMAFALAYMAGIQEDQFDIRTLRTLARNTSFDRFNAVNAFVQGDVAQIGIAYASTVLDSREQIAELNQPIPDNKLLQAPAVHRKVTLFPAREGADFIAALFGTENKGWPGINSAYRKPPVSTEQVLHPEKYFAGEEPRQTSIPVVAAQLGRGWELASSNTMGEFLLRSMLEEHVDEIQAADAAEGWGGDKYVLFSGPEGERLFISLVSFDSFQDRAEFFDAYTVFGTIKVQEDGGTSAPLGDTGRKWVMPEQTIFMGQDGPIVLWIIGSDEKIVGTALDLLFEGLQAAASP